MKNIEQIVKEVSGTMAMEGMHLKERDKERIRICLSDEISFEEMKRRIIEKHTVRIQVGIMGKNHDYSYEWDIKYCYPNSFTLRNKFNITNSEELTIAEMEYTSLTIAEIKENPIKGDFNLKHLQDIHKHIFRDVYDWAGELRTVNISKGNPFCNCMYIEAEAERIFSELKKENYLIGISKLNICDKLAYYLGEINVLHPFREKNVTKRSA